MSWNDRLRESAYTSPSGVRITFDYEDVKKTVEKKTTGFEFPDADGTYVQDLGHSGRRYPLKIIFWGNDYDLQADNFESILLEKGVGKLEHPIYGVVDVVPFGTITRRDDLKTAANQAIIQVTFWETIGLVYPIGQDDPSSAILTSIDKYNTAAAESFNESVDLKSAISLATLKNNYNSLLDNVKNGLQQVADAQQDVQQQFNDIYDSIDQGLNVIVSDPLTLAFQTTLLIQSPARALTNIQSRLSAYGDLANSIISGDGANVQSEVDTNEFQLKDLYASTYVTGTVLSVVNNQFNTKSEAIEAADLILELFDQVTTWRDDNYQLLTGIDTGEAYQKLQETVAIASGYLVEISFSLKQEKRIILNRDRTILDLVAELYGSLDEQLDFFISSNNLSGSEILELKKGREIVYYI